MAQDFAWKGPATGNSPPVSSTNGSPSPSKSGAPSLSDYTLLQSTENQDTDPDLLRPHWNAQLENAFRVLDRLLPLDLLADCPMMYFRPYPNPEVEMSFQAIKRLLTSEIMYPRARPHRLPNVEKLLRVLDRLGWSTREEYLSMTASQGQPGSTPEGNNRERENDNPKSGQPGPSQLNGHSFSSGASNVIQQSDAPGVHDPQEGLVNR